MNLQMLSTRKLLLLPIRIPQKILEVFCYPIVTLLYSGAYDFNNIYINMVKDGLSVIRAYQAWF